MKTRNVFILIVVAACLGVTPVGTMLLASTANSNSTTDSAGLVIAPHVVWGGLEFWTGDPYESSSDPSIADADVPGDMRDGGCGDPSSGECCEIHGTPGCNNATCCERVCNACPDCCEGPWDGYCATLAIYTCGIGCDPIPDPDCPPDALFCQRPSWPTDTGYKSIATSDSGAATHGAIAYERFWGVQSPITGVTWWGETQNSSGTNCHENPMTFEIKFYLDDNGEPGQEVYSFIVTEELMPAGRVFVWGEYRFEWSTQLALPVEMPEGWISIQGLKQGDDDCLFRWWSSPQGDGYSCAEYDGGGLLCIHEPPLALDRSLMLTGASAIVGDVDLDGDVDLRDLAALLGAYGTCAGDPRYNANADFNSDNCVTLTDLAALLGNYGYPG